MCTSQFFFLLQAKVLWLEPAATQRATETNTVDIIKELREVKGVDFCCGESSHKIPFSVDHLMKIGPNSREVFLNCTALPDYDYGSYAARKEVIAISAEEQHLLALHREKHRHSSNYWTWHRFYAFEGVNVTKFD